MRILKRTSRALIAALFAGSALFASAAELTIGLSAPITSLDPHYHNLTPNNALSLNVFEDLLSDFQTFFKRDNSNFDLTRFRNAVIK